LVNNWVCLASLNVEADQALIKEHGGVQSGGHKYKHLYTNNLILLENWPKIQFEPKKKSFVDRFQGELNYDLNF